MRNTNSKIHSIDFTATAACLTALLCWASGPIFVKYLTGCLDSWTQNMLRYATASLFWLPFLFFSIKRNEFDHSIWKKAIFPALINVIMQCFWGASFYYLDPAFINLLNQSSVIWIAGLSIIFFPQERPLIKSGRFIGGLTLCTIGVIGVLVSKENFTAQKTAIGILIALSSSFFWGVYTIAVKVAFKNHDSRESFGVMSLYTTVSLAILAFLIGKPQQTMDLSAWPWFCVVISGILSIALSHTLYYAAIKRIGATIPSIVLLATPFMVLIGSHIVFEESLNILQWFFGIVLLTGAALAIFAQQHLGK